MFNHIIVGVDGSSSGECAVTLAAELAMRFGARLTLIHAFEGTPTWVGEPQRHTRLADSLAHGEALLDVTATRLQRAGVTALETDLLEGPPAQALLNVAEARGADLLVVGSRGLNPLKALLLGSVSERVIGAAPCAVLVAR